MNNNPCFHCQKRHFKCHSTCEGYASYMRECEKIRAARSEESSMLEFTQSVRAKMVKRYGT